MSGFCAGYVVILGEPNVGKSTLMNALIGERLSIVSRKPQTTRRKILGILSKEEYQIVFIDTPGIVEPKYLLHESMMRSVAQGIGDADVVLVLKDATRFAPDQPVLDPRQVPPAILKDKPAILAINKVDVLKQRNDLLPQIEFYNKSGQFSEIIPISAREKINTDRLESALLTHLPEHEPFFPPDTLSDQQERFFVAEIIREKIFEALREELPYATEVQIAEFKEREKGKWFVDAEINVERDSQKAIVIGSKGSTLKLIGERARKDIERFLDHPVFLSLQVKVTKDWRKNKNDLRQFGYE